MTKMLPVLLADPAPDGTWRAWCPFCRKYHMHSPEPGHRAAHCHGWHPHFPDGYLLVERSKACTVKPHGLPTLPPRRGASLARRGAL